MWETIRVSEKRTKADKAQRQADQLEKKTSRRQHRNVRFGFPADRQCTLKGVSMKRAHFTPDRDRVGGPVARMALTREDANYCKSPLRYPTSSLVK